jgi:hypothetical protein
MTILVPALRAPTIAVPATVECGSGRSCTVSVGLAAAEADVVAAVTTKAIRM